MSLARTGNPPIRYTKKTIFPFPFTLNGIWPWWQFSFRFSEPNWNPFGSKSNGKLSPRSDPIQCERKWNTSFLSEESQASRYTGGPIEVHFLNHSIEYCYTVRGVLGGSWLVPRVTPSPRTVDLLFVQRVLVQSFSSNLFLPTLA